jgi:hypothetical protein
MNLGMEICWHFQDQQLEKEKKLTESCVLCDSKYSSSPYDASGATFYTHGTLAVGTMYWECGKSTTTRGSGFGKRNRTKFQKPRRPLNATSTYILCRLHYLTGKGPNSEAWILFTNTCGIATANHFHMPTKCEAFSQTIPTTITISSHCQHIKFVWRFLFHF